MNLVVGISQKASKKYILDLIKNNVSNFFIGYIPDYWYKQYGFEVSLNRRYDYSCQFTDLEYLKKIVKILHKFKKKVFLGINEHYYINKQLPLLLKVINETKDFIDRYIVVNPGIIESIRDKYSDININLSGDFGVYSKTAIDYANKLKVKRIIFPREVLIDEISLMINYAKSKKYNFEFEAFIMEAPCLYNGAYCFIEHGFNKLNFCLSDSNQRELYEDDKYIQDVDVKLNKNCGLCFLKKLKKIGVNYFKVPGRESNVIESVKLLNHCIKNNKILTPEKIQEVKGCNINNRDCYYEL